MLLSPTPCPSCIKTRGFLLRLMPARGFAKGQRPPSSLLLAPDGLCLPRPLRHLSGPHGSRARPSVLPTDRLSSSSCPGPVLGGGLPTDSSARKSRFHVVRPQLTPVGLSGMKTKMRTGIKMSYEHEQLDVLGPNYRRVTVPPSHQGCGAERSWSCRGGRHMAGVARHWWTEGTTQAPRKVRVLAGQVSVLAKHRTAALSPVLGQHIYRPLDSVLTSFSPCRIPLNSAYFMQIPPEIKLVRSHKPQTEIKANPELTLSASAVREAWASPAASGHWDVI